MTLDAYLLLWIQEHLRMDELTPIMQAVTFLGDGGWFWIFLAIVLLFPKKTRKAGIAAGIALLLSLLVNNIWLKPMIDRVRPYEVIEGLTILIDPPHDASFPSGHTGASFAAAVAMYPFLRKPLHVVLILLAAFIAFTRLYLGVHYPTDVLGGMVIGITLGVLAAYVVKTVANKRKG